MMSTRPPAPPRTGLSSGQVILFVVIALVVGLIFGFGLGLVAKVQLL